MVADQPSNPADQDWCPSCSTCPGHHFPTRRSRGLRLSVQQHPGGDPSPACATSSRMRTSAENFEDKRFGRSVRKSVHSPNSALQNDDTPKHEVRTGLRDSDKPQNRCHGALEHLVDRTRRMNPLRRLSNRLKVIRILWSCRNGHRVRFVGFYPLVFPVGPVTWGISVDPGQCGPPAFLQNHAW